MKHMRQVPVTDRVRICRIFGQSATSVPSMTWGSEQEQLSRYSD